MRFSILPASLHDLTPVHELTYGLPKGGRVFGDKGYNSAADEATILDEAGMRLVPIRKANMKPHAWFLDELELREYRHTIKMVNSQLESMRTQQLHVRTNAGRELKLHVSLLALVCTNLD